MREGIGKERLRPSGYGQALAGLVLGLCCAATYAQDIPRTPEGRPDLQGIWKAEEQAIASLQTQPASGNIQAALSVVSGGAIPYKEGAVAQRDANFANRLDADPLNKCYLPGMPRIMSLDYPYQIFQNENHVAMTFQWT